MGELFSLIELLGTVAFAVSGAMVAIERKADIFGVVFLGMTTAIGGGILRDGLLGNIPAAIFSNRPTLLTAAVCPLLVFAAAWLAGDRYERNRTLIDTINNLVDALGLGAFTVTGVRMGFGGGYGDSWFFVVFLGLLTGVGGGVLRDVLTNATPFVLTKRIYALASIAGALVYLVFQSFGMDSTLNGTLAIGMVFCIRVLATVFRWDLPSVARRNEARAAAAAKK